MTEVHYGCGPTAHAAGHKIDGLTFELPGREPVELAAPPSIASLAQFPSGAAGAGLLDELDEDEDEDDEEAAADGAEWDREESPRE